VEELGGLLRCADDPEETRCDAGLRPPLAPVADRLAAVMMEHQVRIKPPEGVPSSQHLAQRRREREEARGLGLRALRIEPDDAAGKVDLGPGEAGDLGAPLGSHR
jgi:hypothetical protein